MVVGGVSGREDETTVCVILPSATLNNGLMFVKLPDISQL